jgi:thioredoxin reductase
MHVARNALQLSRIVTIYTNGDTTRTAAFKEAIGSKASIEIDERPIERFRLGDNHVGVTIVFEDKDEKFEAFLAHNPEIRLRSSELVTDLGLDVSPKGAIAVQEPFGETTVPGVFAAGDAISTLRTIPNAFSTGAVAASGVAGHVQSRLQGQTSVGDFFRLTAKK